LSGAAQVKGDTFSKGVTFHLCAGRCGELPIYIKKGAKTFCLAMINIAMVSAEFWNFSLSGTIRICFA
jgi:hypothetical protein